MGETGPSIEPSQERLVVQKEVIARTETTVPSGQEWVVEMVAKSEVTIADNAKLTVTEMAAGNTFRIQGSGELEIIGVDSKNTTERETTPDAAETIDDGSVYI